MSNAQAHPFDQTIHADVDGDGKEEVLVFYRLPRLLSLAQWNGSQLHCPWQAQSNVKGTADWKLDVSDSFYAADLDANKRDEVLVFKSGDGIHASSLGVLGWSGSELQCLWQVRGRVTGKSSWSLGANDRFYVADLDGR